jgi:hypothetical protein
MALNNSGPLSFGGATAGQSINLELGVSATAEASINSSAFRTLAGVSSAGAPAVRRGNQQVFDSADEAFDRLFAGR